ncbi:MAG TPA: hypothetical protein VF469_03330, partial [Kofleriaceae bacterium]
RGTPDAGIAVSVASVTPSALGSVVNVQDLASCPGGAPAGSTCKAIQVRGCPGIEQESIDATVAILPPSGPLRGTITHFKGGGGQGFQVQGTAEYQAAGFRQVYLSWGVGSDWEQTASHGIKTAACRPATVLAWIFADPSLHGGSRSVAFCGEGFSGGSGQLGYALTDYGMAGVLDYVNELSGPPFSRIDLGCDGSAPPTMMVCGDPVTTRLPNTVTSWENIAAPLQCGSSNVPAAELARWKADSVAVGGTFSYPQTRVEMFDCTNGATAVTAMARLYFEQIVRAEGGTANAAFHCYKQVDGCQGEALGPRGTSEAIQAMLDGCTPRH